MDQPVQCHVLRKSREKYYWRNQCAAHPDDETSEKSDRGGATGSKSNSGRDIAGPNRQHEEHYKYNTEKYLGTARVPQVRVDSASDFAERDRPCAVVQYSYVLIEVLGTGNAGQAVAQHVAQLFPEYVEAEVHCVLHEVGGDTESY